MYYSPSSTCYTSNHVRIYTIQNLMRDHIIYKKNKSVRYVQVTIIQDISGARQQYSVFGVLLQLQISSKPNLVRYGVNNIPGILASVRLCFIVSFLEPILRIYTARNKKGNKSFGPSPSSFVNLLYAYVKCTKFPNIVSALQVFVVAVLKPHHLMLVVRSRGWI